VLMLDFFCIFIIKLIYIPHYSIGVLRDNIVIVSCAYIILTISLVSAF